MPRINICFGLPTGVREDHYPKQRCGSPSISGERLIFSIMFILLLVPLTLSILLIYMATPTYGSDQEICST